MKKRILASLLSLCLLVGLFPATALAVDETPDGETPVVCAELGDCVGDAHDADCPLYVAPSGDEGTYNVDDDTKVIDPDQQGDPAGPTVEEQLAALIAALPAPEDIDPLDEEQVEAVYNQIAEIYAFAEENGLDVEDNKTVNAVIAAAWPAEPLEDSESEVYSVTVSSDETLEVAVKRVAGDSYSPENIIKLVITTSSGATIKQNDFYYMRDVLTNLASVDMSGATCEGNKIPDCAFYLKKGGTKYDGSTASENVKKTSLTSFIFPTGITEIGDDSFSNTGLTSLTIPDTVVTIGGAAFNSIKTNNTELVIPDSVTTIEGWAFYGFNKDGTVATLKLSKNLTSIGATAFASANLIGTLTLPSGLTVLENNTFNGCKFEKVVLNEGLTTINSQKDYGATFGNNTNLKTVVFPSTLTTIQAYAFSGCTSLTEVDLSHVTTLGKNAFENCTALTNIVFSDSITSIAENTFKNCNSLTVVTLPAVTSIGATAFNGCSSMICVDISRSSSITFGTNALQFTTSGSASIVPIIYCMGQTVLTALTNTYYNANTTVRAVTNGGTFAEDTTFTSGTLAIPTKEGYTFGGWYSDSDFNNKVENNTATANTTYYAKWTLDDPTISVSADATSITSNGTATLTATAGHDLGEDVLSYQWYTGTPDSGTKIDGATSSTYTVSGLSATTTYYCVVTATDDGNTATATSEAVTITLATNASSITLAKDNANIADTTVTSKTDDGSFTFTYTATEGLTGITVESSDEAVATVADNSGTVTVTIKGAGTATITVSYAGSETYASAEASFTLTVGVSTYTVSFVSEYGTAPSRQTVNSGTKITLTELTADGYTHTGWVDGDGQTYITTAEVEIKKDMTFTAVWGETLTEEVEHLSDDPVVSTSEPSNATQEEKNAISDTATKVASLTETGLSNAVDTQKTSIVNAAKETDAYKTFASNHSGEGETITVVITSYMSIQVTGASVSDSTKSVTMDITPKYKVEATTARNTSGMTEANTAVLVSATELPVANGNNVVISMPVPSVFASSTDHLYAKHIKGNTTYVYKVTVTGSGDSARLSFTNPHGFSTFILTDTTAASITDSSGNTTYYATLQEAVDAVENGQTIKLEANNSEAVTVGRTVTFTLDQNSKTFSGSVSGSSSRTSVTLNNGTYTCVYRSSSGGGGGGSSSSSYTVRVESTRHGTVKSNRTSASKGTTVTLTVTPDDGYELDELTVTDKNGDTVKLTKSSDTKYTFTMPASKVTVEASFVAIEDEPDEGLPFVDVAESAYYYEAVAWAVENGITGGTSATTFSPDQACTRAQAVTFLWRAAGSPEPETASNPFTDVSTSDYYYDAVLWAVENGITSGTSATTFSPDSTCTRGQIVTFLYRAAGTTATGSNPFTDVADSAYYADAVKWAVAEGVTSGTSATTFGPADACTRAQIVTFIYRANA